MNAILRRVELGVIETAELLPWAEQNKLCRIGAVGLDQATSHSLQSADHEVWSMAKKNCARTHCCRDLELTFCRSLSREQSQPAARLRIDVVNRGPPPGLTSGARSG
jgi:hypothetical protein